MPGIIGCTICIFAGFRTYIVIDTTQKNVPVQGTHMVGTHTHIRQQQHARPVPPDPPRTVLAVASEVGGRGVPSAATVVAAAPGW